MFFNKSRAAKKLTAEQARVELVKGAQEQLDAALLLPDPAERLLKVSEIGDSVRKLARATASGIHTKSLKKIHTSFLGVSLGTLGTTAVAVVGLHFPPALLFLSFPAMFGGVAVGALRHNRSDRKGMKEADGLFEGLARIGDQADSTVAAILRDHLEALADSPKIPDMLARVPQLREHFSAAFIEKRTAAARAPAAETPNPAGKGGLSL